MKGSQTSEKKRRADKTARKLRDKLIATPDLMRQRHGERNGDLPGELALVDGVAGRVSDFPSDFFFFSGVLSAFVAYNCNVFGLTS